LAYEYSKNPLFFMEIAKLAHYFKEEITGVATLLRGRKYSNSLCK
jgi:hypothetical protein